MIHVIATIELNSGSRDAFLAEFHKLIPLVRQEVGCIEYGPAIDVETGIEPQQFKGEDSVTVIEKWESVAALKDHLAAPHMTSYRETVKDLVSEVTLHILQPA